MSTARRDALARHRLAGRPDRGALRRLQVGVILGVVACAAIAAGTFIAARSTPAGSG